MISPETTKSIQLPSTENMLLCTEMKTFLVNLLYIIMDMNPVYGSYIERSRRQTGTEASPNLPEERPSIRSPPPDYEEGPHKLISDSLFSLIIFIYVSITFMYMFYAFCWRSPDPKPIPEGEKPDLPMITEILDQVEEQAKLEKKDSV